MTHDKSNVFRSAPAHARARRHASRVAGTMLVVGSLFAVAALPAYAYTEMQVSINAPSGRTQGFEASPGLASSMPIRDKFRVTTPEELAEIARKKISIASTSRASGDDYPWPYEATDDEGGALSPLSYYFRECVDFAAWRLNRDAGYTAAPFKWKWADLTPNGGSGDQWLGAWQSKGWPVSNVPEVGSIAYMGSNHVAYVSQVLEGGFVVLEEYNWVPHEYSQRTIATASVVAFLYPPSA